MLVVFGRMGVASFYERMYKTSSNDLVRPPEEGRLKSEERSRGGRSRRPRRGPAALTSSKNMLPSGARMPRSESDLLFQDEEDDAVALALEGQDRIVVLN